MTSAPYNINWLVFITEMKSVYSAVRTGSLNKAVCASSLNVLNYSFSGTDISHPSKVFFNQRHLIVFCFRIYVFIRRTLSVFSSGSRPLLCSRERRRVTDVCTPLCGRPTGKEGWKRYIRSWVDKKTTGTKKELNEKRKRRKVEVVVYFVEWLINQRLINVGYCYCCHLWALNNSACIHCSATFGNP